MSGAKGTPTKVAAGISVKDSTAVAIQRIKQQREDRRRSAEHFKREKEEEVARIEATGMPIFDVDFQRMILAFRATADAPRPHAAPGEHDICVVVRKRPINKRETANRDWDAVTCLNPRVIVHAPKLKVDGISKYLENTQFEFDHTFDENSTTDDIYKSTVMPLVAYAFQKRGRGTCIAYGQTGSGKSYTINGIQQAVVRDIFRAMGSKDFKDKGLAVHVSMLEIYGARCADLLHGRNKVLIREDGKQRVVASGLEEEECDSAEQLLETIAAGNAERATHATEVNAQSSRSHAICEITIRNREGKSHGSISLVDLAGSERAADSRNHNRQRRLEGAEINKSLLALKECIRALAVRGMASEETHVHVPFRASKLTLALRDSFISTTARVVMIATVSPNASSADHTQNTLRYGDRVKEKPLGGAAMDAMLHPVEEDEDSEGMEHGGGGGSSARRFAPDVTFSFLQPPPGGSTSSSSGARSGSGVAGGAGADALIPPRMSPVVVDHEDDAPPSAPVSGAGAGKRGVAASRVGVSGVPVVRTRGAAARVLHHDPDSKQHSDTEGEGSGDLPSSAEDSKTGDRGALSRGGGSRAQPPVAGGSGRGVSATPAASGGGIGSGREEDSSNRSAAGGKSEDRAPLAAGVRKPVDRGPLSPLDKRKLGIKPSILSPEARKPVDSHPPSPPEDVVEPAKPPASVNVASAALVGGFRKLMQRQPGGVGGGAAPVALAPLPDSVIRRPPTPLAAPSEAGGMAQQSLAPPTALVGAGGGGGAAVRPDLRNKLRERGRIFKAPSLSSLAAPGQHPGSDAIAPGGSGEPSSAPASRSHSRGVGDYHHSGADEVDSDEDDIDDLLGRAGLSKSEVDRDGHRTTPRLIQSFMPLPASRYPPGEQPQQQPRRSDGGGGNGTRVQAQPPAPGGATKPAVTKLPLAAGTSASTGTTSGKRPSIIQGASPQRDLAMVHTMRRDELRSRGGESVGGRPPTAPTTAAGREREAAEEVDESPLMQLHETAGVILDEEEALLNAHMASIQENAEVLTEEGRLLAEVQGRDVVDYDIDRYALRLHELLRKKLATTQALLNQLAVFREHLVFEEQVSKQVDDDDLRLA